jgi:hypothetical protein
MLENMNNIQNFNKTELLITFITKSVLFTALVDLGINLRPITYILLFIIGILFFRYRFYKLLNKGKIKRVIRSRVFTILFPILIIIAFSYKGYVLGQYHKNSFITDYQWRLVKIKKADNIVYLDNEQMCDTVKFYKYGMNFTRKQGIINIKYRFNLRGKIKFLAWGANNLNGEGCSAKFLISDFAFKNGLKFEILLDKMTLENNDIEVGLKRIQ